LSGTLPSAAQQFFCDRHAGDAVSLVRPWPNNSFTSSQVHSYDRIGTATHCHNDLFPYLIPVQIASADNPAPAKDYFSGVDDGYPDQERFRRSVLDISAPADGATLAKSRSRGVIGVDIPIRNWSKAVNAGQALYSTEPDSRHAYCATRTTWGKLRATSQPEPADDLVTRRFQPNSG